MPKFIVYANRTVVEEVEYTVEAESAEAAAKAVDAGNEDNEHVSYTRIVSEKIVDLTDQDGNSFPLPEGV